MATYFLGIDGGASSGKWTLIDGNGALVSHGTGAAIDGHIYDAKSRGRLTEFLNRIEPSKSDEIRGVYCGLTGISASTDVTELKEIFSNCFRNAKITIEQDVLLGYRTHFKDRRGVFLYAGTGSVAVVEREGQLLDVGGWGYLLGDEGAGYWIGIQALRLFAAKVERREELDSLSQLLSREIDTTNWDGIRRFVYSSDRSAVAAFSKIVISLAKDGDEPSLQILAHAARELTWLIKRAEQLSGISNAEIVFGGGIANADPIVKKFVEKELGRSITLSSDDYSKSAAYLALQD